MLELQMGKGFPTRYYLILYGGDIYRWTFSGTTQ